MGSSLSCVPHQNIRFSSKSFIRRNRGQLFRKKNPQVGQEKSNSIINILCNVNPRKDMSYKDLQMIENLKWDPTIACDPLGGWKKSSVNVKNYGRMVHSSKVRFRFLHCQGIHDCFLDLFQTHLHFVSNKTTGPTYQGTLPLKELKVCHLQDSIHNCDELTNRFAFKISGVSLNPIVVYCSNQEELDSWMGLLKEHVEASGGTVMGPEARTYARRKREDNTTGREELRNSVKNDPIYEWEGSQRDSLGPITYVTKARLQHLPCQEEYDRLLVLYPSTLIILSNESDGLFYKGKLPLNMVTLTTPCQDVKPNTFMIEGKLINPIIVTCLNKNEFCDWIGHFRAAQIPIQSPPQPVYDIIYTPTKKEAPEFDQQSAHNSHGWTESLRLIQSGQGTSEPTFQNHADIPLSPGYTEPLCYISSRPTSTETQLSAGLSSRTNSVSSYPRATDDLRPPSLPYSSPRLRSCDMPQVPPSPVYNTPYISVYRHGLVQQEKTTLTKSNSWSTPQTLMTPQLSHHQRNSDMCTPRKPLSPLYDKPYTSGKELQEEQVRPVCWQRQMGQPGPGLLPSSFSLQSPPLGRRNKNNPSSQQEVDCAKWVSEQRAEAISKLRLLSPPTAVVGCSNFTPKIILSQKQHTSHDLQDSNAFLRLSSTEYQDMNYDNIWENDCDRIAQSSPQFLVHRMVTDFGRTVVSSSSTQQRWS